MNSTAAILQNMAPSVMSCFGVGDTFPISLTTPAKNQMKISGKLVGWFGEKTSILGPTRLKYHGRVQLKSGRSLAVIGGRLICLMSPRIGKYREHSQHFEFSDSKTRPSS